MQVELEIYSGQPNPTWSLTPDETAEFARRLADLPPRLRHHPVQQGLGYRGLRVPLRSTGEALTISGGLVVREAADGSVQQFDDAQRQLEAWLLHTASGRLDEPLRQLAVAQLATSFD